MKKRFRDDAIDTAGIIIGGYFAGLAASSFLPPNAPGSINPAWKTGVLLAGIFTGTLLGQAAAMTVREGLKSK